MASLPDLKFGLAGAGFDEYRPLLLAGIAALMLAGALGLGLPVYTHGSSAHINSMAWHDRFSRLGISEFYLD